MNVNMSPVSFARVMKVVGNKPLSAAQRAAEFLNDPYDVSQAEKGFAARINLLFPEYPENTQDRYDVSMAISFNNDKTAYILTGKEADVVYDYEIAMLEQIEVAKEVYGEGSDMAKLVEESEKDKFNELAKKVVLGAKSGTLRMGFDTIKDRITSLDIVG